jgi:hypothetical protein
MSIAKSQKIARNYLCKICDYTTSNLYDFNKHNKTQKHIINDKSILSIEKSQKSQHGCACGKTYKDNSGLWRHKQKCNYNNDSNNDSNNDNISDSINDTALLTNLVIEVVKNNNELQKQCVELQKQNHEFQQKMVESFSEVIKNGTYSNTVNNINSHNKTFNLQFFLNETCKDAMNIMDFVDSIKLQLSDLENVGKLGYVDGISKIIVSNLNSLDETKRPVHCTDSKREVMYIKDENKWEKENENKQKIRKVIKHVTHKNSKLLKDFKTKYPGCEKSESKFSDKYDKLIIEAMGGKGDNDIEKEDKIIRNIAKTVTIDK